MTEKITVEAKEWEREENRYKYCTALENGNFLSFENFPPFLSEEDLKGLQETKKAGQDAILHKYCQNMEKFLSLLLTPYAHDWKIAGVKLKMKETQEEVLHLDTIADKPVHGSRILRIFMNLHQTESALWVTSSAFKDLAKQFLEKMPKVKSMQYGLFSRLEQKMLQKMKEKGLKKTLRSPYDNYMLSMQKYLKENEGFQKDFPKDHWTFFPNTCWAVFTDQVSHAVFKSSCVLELTIFIPQRAMLCPEKSPVSILELMTGKNVVNLPLLRELFPIC